jgi:hypothetical protein
MEKLTDKMFDELKIAMKYNNNLYIEEVIKIVMDFSCPTYNTNTKRSKIMNQDLYDALVKYNKIKGLYDNART